MLEQSTSKKEYNFANVKIKQEKLSPPPKKENDADEILSEIINPISSLFESSEDSNNEREEEVDDKKAIEPAKSSNEILAELFKVFNAAPPESLLNDDYLLKKKKKHKNKEKKQKKKSKKRSKTRSHEEGSDYSGKSKKKHKKKKRKKSKKRNRSKEKKDNTDKVHEIKAEIKTISPLHQSEESELTLSEEDEFMNYPQPIIDTTIVKEEKLDNSTKKSATNKIVIKSLKDSAIFKDAERACKHRQHKKIIESTTYNKAESSDITLSDEDEYLREKEQYFKSKDYYERKSRYRDHHSRARYDLPRDRFRNDWRSRSRSRHRRRTRSRSRSHELMIDKKRLLDIARKNAITMFKSGSLPGTQGMTQEVKDKVVMKMRYGGKTVEELTEFCKKLSKGESLHDLSDLSSNEDSDHDKYGNEKVFYHPFVLKDRGPIVMNIKNATPIPPKSAEQTKAILMQYPVSSGQMHRMTESEWVPVSPKRPEAASLPPPKPQPPKNVFAKPLPSEQQQPAFTPLPPTIEAVNDPTARESVVPDSSILSTVSAVPPDPVTPETTTPSATSIPPTISLPPVISLPAAISLPPPISLPPTISIPSIPVAIPANESIFPLSNQNIDVSSIISQRLNAMRKLQENPTDPVALKMMYNSQKEMSAWATSNFTPGQFTGTTGAKILTAQELTAGQQAWAKRDQLTTTAPVSGGMGMRLLQKMGWKPGEGLGKEKNGALQPLLLEVKLDKRGLVTNEEDPTQASRPKRTKKPNVTIKQQQQQQQQQQPQQQQQQQQLVENKHPVSLLGELAAKRKWGVPFYELVSEEGPAHHKNFVFKVVLDGVMYQPSISCNNKKKAKALAAQYCLQQIGILPV